MRSPSIPFFSVHVSAVFSLSNILEVLRLKNLFETRKGKKVSDFFCSKMEKEEKKTIFEQRITEIHRSCLQIL